jgi:hypothetical protein
MLSNSESEDQDDSLIAGNGGQFYNSMSNSISTSSNSFSSPLSNFQINQQQNPQPSHQLENTPFQLIQNSLQLNLLNEYHHLNSTKSIPIDAHKSNIPDSQNSYFDMSNSIGSNCFNLPSMIQHSVQEMNVTDNHLVKHFENLV